MTVCTVVGHVWATKKENSLSGLKLMVVREERGGRKTDVYKRQPPTVLVTVGEQVSAGQLIAAAPEGALSANLHASIDGVVVSVGDAIVIRKEG